MEQNRYVPPVPQPPPYTPPVSVPCAVPARPPKPLFPLSRGDTAFALCGVVGCILLSVWGLFGGMALGYLLSMAALLVLFLIYFAKGGRWTLLSAVSGLLALGMGAVFVCTTNGSVRFFGTVLGFLLALVCFDGLVNGRSVGNRQTVGVFFGAVSALGNVGMAIRSLFSNGKGDKKAVGKVLIGLLCSLPVVAVVVPLLISSDYAFRGLMTNLFSDAAATIAKSVFGLLLALPAVSYGFSLKYRRTATLRPGGFAGIENVYIVSFLSVISLCYLLYLYSQLAYFFSAFRGFLPEGEITYAQYARKGFFEMCVIAVINLGLVFLAMLLAKKRNGKVGHGVKAVATFIALFTLIIIATAISKMVLYIAAYGMTVLRLTTSAFMVFLAVVFVTAILRIYIRRVNVVKTALLTAGLVVLVLGVGNVNGICARYNYEAYMTQKLDTVDVQAMYELGDEGIPYLVKLTYCADESVSSPAKAYLIDAYLYDYFEDMQSAGGITVETLKAREPDKGFSHFSLPRSAAYDSLYRYVEQYPDFAVWCWSCSPWCETV